MQVMLVEDNEMLAAAVVKALRTAGFSVNHISRGDQALAALKTSKPDILVLDLGLPGMDGLEVLRGARRQQHAVGGRWGADRGQDVGWKAPDARNHECLMGPHRAHSRAAQLFAPTSSSCSSGKDLF